MGRARDIANLIGGATPDVILKTSDGAILNLQTSDTTVTADSVLGAINFQAPDEADGTDAILVASKIEAIAEGTFSASSNATSLVFSTASSAAAGTVSGKMTFTSGGNLIIKDTDTADGSSPTITLQTGDTDIAANDVLGSINFQAPDEGTGTDAILVGAGIDAVSEGDFSSSSNATKLSFKTASSAAAAETMSLSSAGLLTIADDLVIGDGKTIGPASLPGMITLASDGEMTLTSSTSSRPGITMENTNADSGCPFVRFHKNSASPADSDQLEDIHFDYDDDGGNVARVAQINAFAIDVSDTTEDGSLQFNIMKAGTIRDYMTLHTSEISFNEDRQDVDLRIESANQGNQLVVDAGLDTVLIGTSSEYSGTSADLTVNKHLDVGDSSSSDNAVIAGAKSATTGTILSIQSKVSGFSTMPKINFVTSNVGGGSQTGELEFFTTLNASQTLNFKIDGNGDLKANDTSIGSLSDERLKKDIEDFTYDLEKFKKLETKSFKWINPVQHGGKSDTVYGTIAQQIESVDADFITDDLLKDTLDNNGFEETNPDYTLAKDTNGVAKVSKITGKKDAMFISVIQQLISKVETLEDEVKVLKG